MGKTHLVIPDAHAHFEHNNNRALWLGNLICDLKPDVVVNLGDTADMPSLSSYDKGKRSFVGRSYKKDIAAANDFEDKLWSRVRKQKKKLPYRCTLIGNHENRITRAVDLSPELEGVVTLNDLNLDYFYNDIVDYEGHTPGIIEIDGIQYAHYFVNGLMGKPVSGVNQANSLLNKRYVSSTQGHSHTFDYSVRTKGDGNSIMGLVAGCFQDYDTDWAGTINRMWWSGVLIKRNVYRGSYDLEMISIDRLRREYA